jgi:hypothetical protein
MRFIVSPPDRITEEMLQQVYLSGVDRTPWPVQARRVENELWLERAASDSCNLSIPWMVPGHGCPVLSTATLREVSKPYCLPLELVRGKLAQIRNQFTAWQSVGLGVPNGFQERLSEGTRLFIEAAVGDQGSPRSVELAARALELALDASGILVTAYSDRSLSLRRMATWKLTSFLGADLGATPLDDSTAGQFIATFNAANVPLAWNAAEIAEEQFSWEIADQQIQWCRRNGLTVCAGPLLQLDRHSVPHWLHPWEGDFNEILGFAAQYIEAAVRRYQGKVDLWQCAGRINTADFLSLSEEENVRLAARAIEITQSLDPKGRIFVSFDQPWAEYMAHRQKNFSPIHFADALLRAGIGLTGIVLEINIACAPGGTLPREPLDFSQCLDYWSMLGVPLVLAVTIPSAPGADPLAQCQTASGADWTTAAQQAWINGFVPLMLAKSSVLGVLWNQLRDAEPHTFAHAGLFDPHRQPKPALRTLSSLRQAYLR